MSIHYLSAEGYDPRIVATLSEALFTRHVLDYAQDQGWLAVHFGAGFKRGQMMTIIEGDRGSPDLLMVRERLVVAELKKVGGRESVEQKEWARRLEAAGVETYLWTPRDAAAIVRVLAAA